MNGPHRPCTYRMGVVGERCRHWGEESGKKSTVGGDQRHKQEWKRWTALRRIKHASPGSLSVGEQLVGLPEQLEVHGLHLKYKRSCGLTCANEGMRKTDPGGRYHTCDWTATPYDYYADHYMDLLTLKK